MQDHQCLEPQHKLAHILAIDLNKSHRAQINRWVFNTCEQRLPEFFCNIVKGAGIFNAEDKLESCQFLEMHRNQRQAAVNKFGVQPEFLHFLAMRKRRAGRWEHFEGTHPYCAPRCAA